MAVRLRWMEMAGNAEPEAANQSKVVREIESSNQEVTPHISRVIWYLVTG